MGHRVTMKRRRPVPRLGTLGHDRDMGDADRLWQVEPCNTQAGHL